MPYIEKICGMSDIAKNGCLEEIKICTDLNQEKKLFSSFLGKYIEFQLFPGNYKVSS